MSRKTQIGWISVGVMLCLVSLALTLKMRDCSKARAGEDDKNATTKAPEPPSPFPPLPVPDPLPVPPQLPEVKLHAPEPPPTILRTSAVESEPPPPVAPDPKMDPKAGRVIGEPPMTPPTSADQVKLPPPAITGQPLPTIKFPEDKKYPMPPIGADIKPPPIPGDQPPPNWTPRPEGKKEVQPVVAVKQEPGEPPMVVPAGPVQIYQVRSKSETLPDIARRTLGSSDRCNDILRLNPDLKADSVLPLGATLRLPPDACLQDEADTVKPLPALRPKETEKPKVLPLTGTYPCTLDEHKNLTLPKAIRDQLDNCDTVLVSPGPDHCLWITNHAHLERLADRIEHSPARETDVRIFKRLYYAQTEKTSVTSEGRIAISDKLAQFAGLSQEMVLVGIDEHFELWDAAKWKQYTQQKSAAARAAADE